MNTKTKIPHRRLDLAALLKLAPLSERPERTDRRLQATRRRILRRLAQRVVAENFLIE